MTPERLTSEQFRAVLDVYGAVPLRRLPIPRPAPPEDLEPLPAPPAPIDLDLLLEGND